MTAGIDGFTDPDAGVIPVIVGVGRSTVKEQNKLDVPPAVVTAKHCGPTGAFPVIVTVTGRLVSVPPF